jgi:hypothetical protein
MSSWIILAEAHGADRGKMTILNPESIGSTPFWHIHCHVVFNPNIDLCLPYDCRSGGLNTNTKTTAEGVSLIS